MQKEIELAIAPERIEDHDYILNQGSIALKINSERIKGFKIRKRSIDARSRNIIFRARIIFFIDEKPTTEVFKTNFHAVQDAKPVLIIGAGPAGLFAALQCLEKGLKPIIVERGKDVQERRRDLAKLNREGIVDEDSNYCFGEGGAGTYSDGKLYTRSDKRGDIDKVLKLFVAHGATEDILVNARPHIGTNKLPHIIQAIRETIIEHGGEVIFEQRVVDITTEDNQVTGVTLASGNCIKSQTCHCGNRTLGT
ncbi:NAD(P)/FAD-dependent oxidoreductase [Sphingobacterium sp. SG20118]|uniref:NAD(P)/FAD-dependent oxidoreductase n=1 Tax=Sphingobacterium sp. SG20118 TaxID=3367156 RepID=UPI0037DFBF0A